MSVKLAFISALITSVAAVPVEKQHNLLKGVRLPDYSQYTKTVFVPYTNYKSSDPLGKVPKVNVRLAAGLLKEANDDFHAVSMDSGSTGYTFSWDMLSDEVRSKKDTYQSGFKYLSSSKLLQTGYWVPVKLEFKGEKGVIVHSDTFVLAVEKNVRDCLKQYYGECLEFVKPTPDSKSSSKSAVTKRGLQPMEKRAWWGYMGVGVGRTDDGMQQSTPEKNPLINIYQIGDTPVDDTNFRVGYILRKDGVQLGLTNQNTRGFKTAQKLELAETPCTKNPKDTWKYPKSALEKNWGPPKMCITIQDTESGKPAPPCVQGHWLVDTGLPSMYMTVPPEIGAKTIEIQNPNNKNLKSKDLAKGQKIIVNVDGAGTVEITRGSGQPEEPTVVLTTVTPPAKKAPWANVGNRLLRTHDVMFDVARDGGYYAMRVNSPIKSGSKKKTSQFPS